MRSLNMRFKMAVGKVLPIAGKVVSSLGEAMRIS